MFTRA